MVRALPIARFVLLTLAFAATACARGVAPAPPGSGYTPAAVADTKEGREVGNRAPDFEAKDVLGQSFKLSDYRGKVVVLDFWGFW